ncbi:MAG TPA: M23 family metallopeptidase [Vicinamibacterales bacterium]|jgi:murein DD-endopeptidase MepM/ murein hydrolase activator NlpD|nr:M23 family metallopeptidase [Vicinamibacterales bacterium]
MRVGAASVCVLVLSIVASVHGQPPRPFPAIDVRVPETPQPFSGEGRTHLAYELHVTNLSPRRTALESVDVLAAGPGGGPGPALLHLEGGALASAVRRLGMPADAPPLELDGGQTTIVFVWITIAGTQVPPALAHRFAVSVSGQALTVEGVTVPVNGQAPRVIGPPLAGDRWLAANGPDNGSDHRRTLLALAGEGRIAQRFAIDWVRLYDDGRTVRGDPLKNASYRAYGADVLAVADGVVADVRDGIPENTPDPTARAVPITPETLVGNYVMLDIGGAFAVYAHLQPGSLRVGKGDRVRRGAALGRLGNSGNSTEPHLHFHLADRGAAIDSEGVPYAIDAFGLEAASAEVTPAIVPAGNSLAIDPSALSKWTAAAPRPSRSEIPMVNAIVAFGDRGGPPR